jgi:tRNA G46 methylase TrmB
VQQLQVQQVRQQQEQQQEQLQQLEQQQELQELELLFCRKQPKKLPTKKRLIVIFSFYFLKRLANHLTVI